MEAIKSWAVALCAAAVGCSLLHMVAPKNGMGRIFRLITAAFFLCSLLAPLMTLKHIRPLAQLELPESVTADTLQERVNSQIERQINAALLRVTNETLKNYGTKAEKVEAKTDTSADGGICITQIVLYMDKQHFHDAIAAKQVMEKRLEVEVLIQEADDTDAPFGGKE